MTGWTREHESMDATEQEKLFDRWLAAHKGLLFKVVRAYAVTPQDQEDLFQEIAIQVWNSIPNFRQDSAETTWIYRVALYSALAWSRKEKKHSDKKQSLNGMEQTLLAESGVRDNRLEWLYQQIRRLDEVDRSLTLLLLDGFSYREMAATLGISESNVGVKINRIKKYLSARTPGGGTRNGL